MIKKAKDYLIGSALLDFMFLNIPMELEVGFWDQVSSNGGLEKRTRLYPVKVYQERVRQP